MLGALRPVSVESRRRTSITTPGHNYSVPAEHGALMRVAAEGDFLFIDGQTTTTGLIQAGYAQTNGVGLDGQHVACNSSLMTRFAERGYLHHGAEPDYVCQFFGPPVGAAVVTQRFSVTKREGTEGNNDWSAYIDGVRVWDLDDAMQKANLIYAGGEFTRGCPMGQTCQVQTGCAKGTYGATGEPGSLDWERATAPFFTATHVVQSSFVRNDSNKWSIGKLPGRFVVKNRAC
jgi:hypothetical protein